LIICYQSHFLPIKIIGGMSLFLVQISHFLYSPICFFCHYSFETTTLSIFHHHDLNYLRTFYLTCFYFFIARL
jgi:hypothetical protein